MCLQISVKKKKKKKKNAIPQKLEIFIVACGIWCSSVNQETGVQSQVESYQRKTQKMVLDHSLLNTENYKVWIKGKWSNPGKEVAPSLTTLV